MHRDVHPFTPAALRGCAACLPRPPPRREPLLLRLPAAPTAPPKRHPLHVHDADGVYCRSASS